MLIFINLHAIFFLNYRLQNYIYQLIGLQVMAENEKIKEIRKELGLTQQKMADALCVSKQYLSKVENGLTELSKEKIILLCEKFNISVNWLLMDKGFMYLGEIEQYKGFKNSIEQLLNSNERLGLFCKYYLAIYDVIKLKYKNALMEDILDTAKFLFIKEFSTRKLKNKNTLDIIKNFNENKFSDKFKETIYSEYCKLYVEKHENIK